MSDHSIAICTQETKEIEREREEEKEENNNIFVSVKKEKEKETFVEEEVLSFAEVKTTLDAFYKDLEETFDETAQGYTLLPCDNCSLVVTQFYCRDCKRCYCDSCATIVHGIPAFSDHVPLPISVPFISNFFPFTAEEFITSVRSKIDSVITESDEIHF
jgi:hypothetical protein